MHERGIRVGEARRKLAPQLEPGERAARGVALRSGGAARAEPAEGGAK
jgi:hypothetical protein